MKKKTWKQITRTRNNNNNDFICCHFSHFLFSFFLISAFLWFFHFLWSWSIWIDREAQIIWIIEYWIFVRHSNVSFRCWIAQDIHDKTMIEQIMRNTKQQNHENQYHDNKSGKNQEKTKLTKNKSTKKKHENKHTNTHHEQKKWRTMTRHTRWKHEAGQTHTDTNMHQPGLCKDTNANISTVNQTQWSEESKVCQHLDVYHVNVITMTKTIEYNQKRSKKKEPRAARKRNNIMMMKMTRH